MLDCQPTNTIYLVYKQKDITMNDSPAVMQDFVFGALESDANTLDAQRRQWSGLRHMHAIDPLDLAARIPAGTPVLLTCSDSDAQASCAGMRPLADALAHTALQYVALKGVNHVLRDDPTDNIANYAKKGPLSPRLSIGSSRR